MMRNFATLEKQLSANPAVYAKTHLLSISFDPEHDTPERLRAYGASYIGNDSKNVFTHWDIAVPDPSLLPIVTSYFDIGVTTGSDSMITHTLSTTLIGPDGKVVRYYSSNEWKADELLADITRLLVS
jgi:protein SCO1/2